ncbi:MAG: cysteine--tRNA ligase, partial [Bdellovibrionales bacterium]|nr:cysteine--tRNA ligase [Bdellovibrionales bacterium]
DVYYAVRTLHDYGKLSGRKLEDLKAGARVEPGENKLDPLDFALWKSSKPGEPTWESPWGKGRPAWHIECSAMNRKFLGETIDIHAGGRDLIFPHHENEIAQSEGANDKPFSKYWIHNGFLTLQAEKMSKSLGNTMKIKDVLSRFHPEALKLYFFSTHYRHPMDFSDQGLEESTRALSRLYRVLYNLPPTGEKVDESFMKQFEEVMNQDFNVPKAVGLFFEIARSANRLMQKNETLDQALILSNTLKQMSKVLGILSNEPAAFFKTVSQSKNIDGTFVEQMIAERHQARRDKNFDRADEIRQELEKQGVYLEDGPEGTSWRT